MSEVRLIDANPIIDKVEANYRMSEGVQHVCEREFLNLLCDAPTVDAVPVRHGEWHVDMKGYPQIICSLCDVHIPMIAGCCMDAHINYCPNCGARMKGGQE